jgi:hypothetical protein
MLRTKTLPGAHAGSTRPAGAMQARRLYLAGLVVAIAAGAAPTLFADRLTDKDVKALIERIDNERDRFEDQLDGKLKRDIVRGPNGEVNVERHLDDLQENVKRLKERFTSEYAASAEVTTLLRQGSDIGRFMAAQPPNLDGASEWNRLAASLRQLAEVYSTTLPLPEGQQARRMNDREVQEAAEAVAESADAFKKHLDTALKNDKTVQKPTRDAAVKEVEALKQDAKKLASLLGGGRPSSGEAKALVERAARIRAAATGRPSSPELKSWWGAVETGLETVARAFAIPAR